MIREIAFTDVLLLVAVVGVLYQIRRLHRGSGFHRDAARVHVVHGGSRRRRFGILALELLELILASVFFVVGIAKLIGRPEMVSLFDHIGVGQWLRYATGSIEVAGAALLIVPALSGEAALLLGGVMIAATLIELFVLHRPPVAALACLGGHATVAGARASRRVRAWLHHSAGVPAKPSQWPKLPRRKRRPAVAPTLLRQVRDGSQA
jgi:putative oxidoreductase